MNEIIEILGNLKGKNSFDDKITIICHKHHAGVLEYLAYNNWDTTWIGYSQLKTIEPMLVAMHIEKIKIYSVRALLNLNLGPKVY